MTEDFHKFDSFEKAFNFMLGRLSERRHTWKENKGQNPLEKIKAMMFVDVVYNVPGNYFAVVDRIGSEDYDYQNIGCIKVLTIYWDDWYYVGEMRELKVKVPEP
jgi:hypothetical protein